MDVRPGLCRDLAGRACAPSLQAELSCGQKEARFLDRQAVWAGVPDVARAAQEGLLGLAAGPWQVPWGAQDSRPSDKDQSPCSPWEPHGP